jgi:hypothetical protein
MEEFKISCTYYKIIRNCFGEANASCSDGKAYSRLQYIGLPHYLFYAISHPSLIFKLMSQSIFIRTKHKLITKLYGVLSRAMQAGTFSF